MKAKIISKVFYTTLQHIPEWVFGRKFVLDICLAYFIVRGVANAENNKKTD